MIEKTEKTQDHFYREIDGFFDFENFYRGMVAKAPESAKFVEVGAWLGRSTAFLLVEIINSNKNITFDVVDTWKGTIDDDGAISGAHIDAVQANNGDIYNKFLQPFRDRGLDKRFTPHKCESAKASESFEDESLDLVYIDANHSYENVTLDITKWLPKVKKGGTIAGHDYINSADIRKAVADIFGDKFTTNGQTWIYVK